MIKQLVMKADEDGGSWEVSEQDYELFLCKDGVCKYFDVPEDSREILLCASNASVRGATKAEVILHNSCFSRLLFDDVDVLITKEIGEWFPEGTFWFWIEYSREEIA